jgi:antitoxin HicB
LERKVPTEAALPRFEIRPLTPDEGGGYLIEFPDFPGCMSDGETPEEAIREGADALRSYRETLERPSPRVSGGA